MSLFTLMFITSSREQQEQIIAFYGLLTLFCLLFMGIILIQEYLSNNPDGINNVLLCVIVIISGMTLIKNTNS
jgi:hypothetical protein